MKRFYKLYVDSGFVGAEHVEIVEVPDDEDMPSDSELDDLAKDYLFECIEYEGYECDENGKRIERSKLPAPSE